MQDIPYDQAVGLLFYLAVATRPDITQFSRNPGMRHWRAVKHLFRYLKGTIDYKLTYSPPLTPPTPTPTMLAALKQDTLPLAMSSRWAVVRFLGLLALSTDEGSWLGNPLALQFAVRVWVQAFLSLQALN